jgi:hypothetical protein
LCYAVDPDWNGDKRRWETVKHHFRRIPHQNYLAQFRHYLEKHGTKKQKLDKIDDHTFDMFERARENTLPMRDIDLRQWAFMNMCKESLYSKSRSK